MNRNNVSAWLIVFLILPFVLATSADNEKHLLHGSWVSQGEWEEAFELTFHPDGTYHMLATAIENVSAEEDYEDEEDAEFTEFMTDLFGEEMVITISITGTWESTDNQFALTPLEVVYEFNGLSLAEFYTLVLEDMFDLIVQESEMNSEEAISEEEWFQFMLFVYSMDSGGNPVDVPESASLEELKELVVGQMVLMFESDFEDAPLMEVENFVFSLDDDEMTGTDSDGETLVFVRVKNATSVVETSSWGQIKALHP